MSQVAGPLGVLPRPRSPPELGPAIRVLATTRLVADFSEHFYQLLLRSGHGESSSLFHCMAEGRFDSVRCDVAVLLSPASFVTFAVPELRLQTDCLDHSLFNELVGVWGIDGSPSCGVTRTRGDPDDLATLVWGVARGEVGKVEVAEYLRRRGRPYEEWAA